MSIQLCSEPTVQATCSHPLWVQIERPEELIALLVCNSALDDDIRERWCRSVCGEQKPAHDCQQRDKIVLRAASQQLCSTLRVISALSFLVLDRLKLPLDLTLNIFHMKTSRSLEVYFAIFSIFPSLRYRRGFFFPHKTCLCQTLCGFQEKPERCF